MRPEPLVLAQALLGNQEQKNKNRPKGRLFFESPEPLGTRRRVPQ
jgi:hypothetical protein